LGGASKIHGTKLDPTMLRNSINIKEGFTILYPELRVATIKLRKTELRHSSIQIQCKATVFRTR
jgi:hypothetical protein